MNDREATGQERDAIARSAHVDLTSARARQVRDMLASRFGDAVPVTDDMVRVVLFAAEEQS